MAAQFTPGPWRYGPTTNYSGFYIAPGNRYPILAALHENGRYEAVNFPGQTEANARLIAAAPELVDACEDALKTLTAETIGTIHMDDPDWYLAVDRAVEKLRAALSKARGETPSTLNLEGERG